MARGAFHIKIINMALLVYEKIGLGGGGTKIAERSYFPFKSPLRVSYQSIRRINVRGAFRARILSLTLANFEKTGLGGGGPKLRKGLIFHTV